ncbi:MAG TPA: hypothetical protein VE135_10230 [Pyrinomonadaceae bacterium]|nr:hypothetical protein [Pyrinomonadaceae bacterium]
MFNLESTNSDHTNSDGLYYINLPPDITKFMLVYQADGHWRAGSSTLNSDRDPIKVERRTLEKKDPNNIGQLESIDTILAKQFQLYTGSTSAAIKEEIKKELTQYLQEISVPPPVVEFFQHERLVKLEAKSKIQTLLAQLK